MIAPSRRRRTEPPPDATFALHLVAARRLATARRTTRGALGALAGAAVALLVGVWFVVPPPYRLAAALLGALVGAALPLRSAAREALDDIGRRTGWAYESALELLERRSAAADAARGAVPSAGEPTFPDEFGLEAGLLARARRSVADYAPAPAPRWWLPLAVLALALTALPSLLTRPAPPSTAGGSSGSPAATDRPPEGAAVDRLLDLPSVAGRAEDPGATRTDAAAPSAADPLRPGASGSGDALSRYLEALRQADGSSSQAGGPGGSGGGQPGSDGAGGEAPMGDSGGTGPGTPTGGAGAPAGAGGTAPGTPDTDAHGEGAAPGADEVAGGNASAQAGGEAQETGDPAGQTTGAARATRPGAEDPRDAPDPGETEGTRGDMGIGFGSPEEGQREAPAGATAAGTGGEEAGADGSPGAGGAMLVDDAERSDVLVGGGVQLLPGVILDGPTTPAGTVRLPGDDMVELPVGTPLAPYGTAAEEALGEGDLPAAYQEIIRRYFR